VDGAPRVAGYGVDRWLLPILGTPLRRPVLNGPVLLTVDGRIRRHAERPIHSGRP